jgi:hypothetical protein
MRLPGSTARSRPRLSAATACLPLQKRFSLNCISFSLLMALSGRDKARAKERGQHKHSNTGVSMTSGAPDATSQTPAASTTDSYFAFQTKPQLVLISSETEFSHTLFSHVTARVTPTSRVQVPVRRACTGLPQSLYERRLAADRRGAWPALGSRCSRRLFRRAATRG